MYGKTILQKAIKSDAPVWLLFLAMSAWAVYPVLASPMQRVVGWAGDNIQYMYMLGWVAKALRTSSSLGRPAGQLERPIRSWERSSPSSRQSTHPRLLACNRTSNPAKYTPFRSPF